MSFNGGLEEPAPSTVEMEDRIHFLRNQESSLREKYEKCITWNVKVICRISRLKLQYFTALTLLSIPISYYTKNYTPLFAGAVIGSGADVLDAKVRCGKIANNVRCSVCRTDVQLDDVIDEREKLQALLAENKEAKGEKEQE